MNAFLLNGRFLKKILIADLETIKLQGFYNSLIFTIFFFNDVN